MTNTNYKELYLNLIEENNKLKRELENKITLIDFMQEEIDFTLSKIDNVADTINDLEYTKRDFYERMKSISGTLNTIKNKK